MPIKLATREIVIDCLHQAVENRLCDITWEAVASHFALVLWSDWKKENLATWVKMEFFFNWLIKLIG